MKLTEKEVERRLKEAEEAGVTAAVICLFSPVLYIVILYLFRSQVVELVRVVSENTFGYEPTVLFVWALVGAPLLFLPKLYHLLSERVASDAHLECPECSMLISSGGDWKICLYTKRCPYCQKTIISRDEHPNSV